VRSGRRLTGGHKPDAVDLVGQPIRVSARTTRVASAPFAAPRVGFAEADVTQP
jgi:hypothetical protein